MGIWMGEWVDGWTGGWMDIWMGGWMGIWMGGWDGMGWDGIHFCRVQNRGCSLNFGDGTAGFSVEFDGSTS